MKLVFASNNAHKLEEVRQILPPAYELFSLKDIGFLQEIEETGTTLEQNSRLKAETVWTFLLAHSSWPIDEIGVFADDTGLEVDALDGAPGVYSARYAGEPSDSARNRAKLLEAMAQMTNRAARFRTVVTLINSRGQQQVDGIVCGCIATQEQGQQGFGYDALFVPEGYDCTFAELTQEEKNQISHRGRAMQRLKDIL